MRKYAFFFCALCSLLSAGSAAHAQPFDVVSCGADTDRVEQTVSASVNWLNKVMNAPASVAQPTRVLAFGDYSSDPSADTWLAAVLVGVMYNTRAVLTGGDPVNVFGGTPPVYPRLRFECDPSRPQRSAKYVGERNAIVIYPNVMFDETCPLTEKYGTNACSRVGTILHEMVHFLSGGGGDITFGGMDQKNSAIELANRNDSRTYTNAENYEMFYMSFLF